MQERASKQLPGPGQHFQFGALQSWETILDYVKTTPGKTSSMQTVVFDKDSDTKFLIG
jgi:hypothetical protein